MRTSHLSAAVGAALIAIAVAVPASATICIVPDNGSGTADLPPNCPSGYLSPSDVHMIIDGLPAGTTVEIDATHSDFFGVTNSPGGSLGGEHETFQSALLLHLVGTGSLSGYNSFKSINGVNDTTDLAPRGTGAVQSFDTDMQAIVGQLPPGDPDFDLLRITAGTAFGMPSPGHTTLTQASGGNWNVDSFFDIEYRIDFVGHPGGPFSGMSGSTTGTIRMQAGEPAVFDHLECLKPKDILKLKALADIIAPGLYAASGCKLGNAVNYCRPAIKQVTVSNVPVVPVPGQNLTNAFICYKMKCPNVAITQLATDQFGSRTLTKLKHTQLCVPAP